MKQLSFPSALCILSLIISLSCSNKKVQAEEYDSDWFRQTTPEFNSERQTIIYRENLKYDIKGNIAVTFNVSSPNHTDFGCEFSFFNYGEDICLFNGCGDDLFIKGLGRIDYAYALNSEDGIDIVDKKHNEKYGEWALANLTVESVHINDVFVTPLAMKAYKDGEDDSFIFIQFVSKDKYMNVLFSGGPKERIIVRSCPDNIVSMSIPSYNIDAPINGPGQFWKHRNVEDNLLY